MGSSGSESKKEIEKKMRRTLNRAGKAFAKAYAGRKLKGQLTSKKVPWFYRTLMSSLASAGLCYYLYKDFHYPWILTLVVLLLGVWYYLSELWFFRQWQFQLFEFRGLEPTKPKTPLHFVGGPIEGRSSSFGDLYLPMFEIENQGDLVVAVGHKKSRPWAILHLKEEGKLDVSSFFSGVRKNAFLKPLSPKLKEIVKEFSELLEIYDSWDEGGQTNAFNRHRLVEQKAEEELIAFPEKSWEGVFFEAPMMEKLDFLLAKIRDHSSAMPKGLLLSGPPGTGKTEIARRLSDIAGVPFISCTVADLKAAHMGGSAQKVREIWQKAEESKRCILFVDECEGIFTRRGSTHSDSFSEEIIQTFLALWDGVKNQHQVMVIGATNRKDRLDEAVLSRFGDIWEIPLPPGIQRIEILRYALKELGVEMSLPLDTQELTLGMSGRDLYFLADKLSDQIQQGRSFDSTLLSELTRSKRKTYSTLVEDSALWSQLVLSESVNQELKTVSGILQHAQTFRDKGISVPRGLLLYGPPGTGKTQIAKTLANEIGLTFLAATTADLKAGHLGQSGQKVKELFTRARTMMPSLVFLDELDVIAPHRVEGDTYTQEVVGQLLQEMEGLGHRPGEFFVLAATNHLEKIDSAVVSRFPKKVEISLPDEELRGRLFALLLSGKPLDFDPGTIALAERSEGMSGRDIRNLVEIAEQKAVARALSLGQADRVSISIEDLLSSF